MFGVQFEKSRDISDSAKFSKNFETPLAKAIRICYSCCNENIFIR